MTIPAFAIIEKPAIFKVMKLNLTQRQKLIVPFLIFGGMILVGVRSIYKGLLLHQNWRVALAAIGVICFTTMLGMMLIQLGRDEKAAAKAPKVKATK